MTFGEGGLRPTLLGPLATAVAQFMRRKIDEEAVFAPGIDPAEEQPGLGLLPPPPPRPPKLDVPKRSYK